MTQGRLTRGGKGLQDIALLLLQRRHDSHHQCNKAGALVARRAKTAFPPQHPRTNCPLGSIRCRFHPCKMHERPQRLTPLQQFAAHAFGLRHPAPAPNTVGATALGSSCRHSSVWHQDPRTHRAQQFARHVAAPRQANHKDGPPRRRGHPFIRLGHTRRAYSAWLKRDAYL